MKIPVLFSIIVILFLSCTKEPDEDIVMFDSNEDSALAVIQEADSLRSVRHGSFRGTHGHGKNAAVHAHQDVAKIRRVMKTEASALQSRREAYRLQDEARRRSFGLLDSLETDNTDSADVNSSDTVSTEIRDEVDSTVQEQ